MYYVIPIQFKLGSSPANLKKKTSGKNEVTVIGYGAKSDSNIKTCPTTINEINSANPPLYILDGKEISGAEMKKLDPNSIESINVLKNKAATDIYGDKGANGVILITLKN